MRTIRFEPNINECLFESGRHGDARTVVTLLAVTIHQQTQHASSLVTWLGFSRDSQDAARVAAIVSASASAGSLLPLSGVEEHTYHHNQLCSHLSELERPKK